MNLEGKVAWVTGGASGIGLALAHKLAAAHAKLVIVDVEASALQAAEAALKDAGADVLAIRADVSKAAEVEAGAARARQVFGLVHVIVNNAGVGGGGGPMWTLSDADWRWCIDVNLWGVIHGLRVLLPPLIASGEEGHVINTASMAGLTSTPFLGPYTATKHAVVSISEVLAKELELVGSKVKVSVLCPGFVKTQIAKSERNRPVELRGSAGAPGPGLGKVMEQLVDAGVPPEQVADAVVAAIGSGKFYILTHPEMKPAIDHRMRQILDEDQPGIDPMMRSLFGAK